MKRRSPRTCFTRRFESAASTGAFILFNIVYLLPNLFIMAALQRGVQGKPHTTSESIKETHNLMDTHRCKYTVAQMMGLCYHKLIYLCIHTACYSVFLLGFFLANRASAFGTCNCFDFLYRPSIIIGAAICLSCQQAFCVCIWPAAATRPL